MSKNAQNQPENSNPDLFDHSDPREEGVKLSKNQNVEKWLKQIYKFRFNTIKQKPEYKPISEDISKLWKPIDKYKLLSIKRDLDAAGHSISKDALLDILCSSYSPAVNPVKEYFRALPVWDGITDYISKLADTVKCRNDQDWQIYIEKWLVSVVANVFIDERCANHTMLVLAGGQGLYKTTWLEHLCPKTLTPYMYTGKIDPTNKDSLTYIAEFLFVNIDDQLAQLNKKDENEIKNLVTVNSVKYRRPYDPIITEYPHLCSFMASVNNLDFLNDATGSRRYLPFEVERIDMDKAKTIDMDLLWSQAFHLFTNGFRYWFNSVEVEKLNERNKHFAIITIEEDLLNYYYKSEASNSMERHIELTTGVILVHLENKSRNKLSKKKLGESLMKLGFKRRQKSIDGNRVWVWMIVEKTQEEIERVMNGNELQESF